MITVEYNIITGNASVIIPNGDMMPGTSEQIVLFRNEYLNTVERLINMVMDEDINNIKIKFDSFKAVNAKLDKENNIILIDFEYIG